MLPLLVTSRNHGGLSTRFLKAKCSIPCKQGLETLAEAAQTLALIEGLDAHANAVRLRLNQQ